MNWRAVCLTPLFKNFMKVAASGSWKKNTPLCGLCYVYVTDNFAVDTLIVIRLLSSYWNLQNVAISPGVTWFANENLLQSHLYRRRLRPGILRPCCPLVFGGGDKLIIGQRTD
jgi:hypothetical protein